MSFSPKCVVLRCLVKFCCVKTGTSKGSNDLVESQNSVLVESSNQVSKISAGQRLEFRFKKKRKEKEE